MTGGVRRALEFAAVFVAYVATARLGLTFDAVGGVATAVWPPSGIALAALTLRGRRLWPAVAAGAFVANVATGIPAWGAAIFAVGNTLEALVGSSLLARFGFDARIGRLRDVLLLVGARGDDEHDDRRDVRPRGRRADGHRRRRKLGGVLGGVVGR